MKSILLLLFVAVFLNACAEKEAPKTAEVSITPIDQTGFKQLLNERNGKILFINVWATWCLPCRDEFPDLAKLAEKYQDSDVEIVTISADFPDEIESKILPFLKQQKAPFANYVRNFSDDGEFINAVNIDWSGALPATIVYDSKGKQRYFDVGEKTYAQFEDAIASARE